MNKYAIYCTPEQTKKAFELGAPIQYANIADIRNNRFVNGDNECYALPTTEQMIGWLEEQEKIDFFAISNFGFDLHTTNDGIIGERNLHSRKEATLAAIDAALEYLPPNKNT